MGTGDGGGGGGGGSTEEDGLDWQEGAPQQAPTVGEDGAWGGDWKNYYDATRGAGSRNNTFDGQTSGAHQRGSSHVPSDGNNVYTNSQGHAVGSDVRVSGRDSDGNILYNGRSNSNTTGMNMLQSMAAPVNLGVNTANNIRNIDSLTDWDGYTTLVTGLAGDVAAVGNMVAEYDAFVEKITDPKFDPVQWLAGTLIDFLIQAFQPLEDLVGLVTGNESRMRTAGTMWNQVSEGAIQVGDYIQQVGTDSLSDWVGHDGDSARTRVEELAESVRGMGFFAVALEALLNQMADVAKLLRQDVVDLIAKGVSWMLTRLLPQAAAAVATFGAWTAGMVAQGIAKVAQLVMNALNSIRKVMGIAGDAANTVNTILQGIQKIKPVLDFLANNKNLVNTAGGMVEQATSLWV